MTLAFTVRRLLAAAALLALPTIAQAGPPLICHPFQTEGGALLPWGPGPGWNSPDSLYAVDRLTADLPRLLDADAPILTRMENMRRATIYAARDTQVADALMAAIAARVDAAPHARARAMALFDAGYLAESYKQAAHLHGRPGPALDGYRMVVEALATLGGSGEMELAAALMSEGGRSHAHLRRARATAATGSPLARTIDMMGW